MSTNEINVKSNWDFYESCFVRKVRSSLCETLQEGAFYVQGEIGEHLAPERTSAVGAHCFLRISKNLCSMESKRKLCLLFVFLPGAFSLARLYCTCRNAAKWCAALLTKPAACPILQLNPRESECNYNRAALTRKDVPPLLRL